MDVRTVRRERKVFFSEEKKQKTFNSGARGTIRAIASILGVAERIRVFWFRRAGFRLFFRKEHFFFFAVARIAKARCGRQLTPMSLRC
jgi:hypothetical protein